MERNKLFDAVRFTIDDIGVDGTVMVRSELLLDGESVSSSPPVALGVADELEIDDVFGRFLPRVFH